MQRAVSGCMGSAAAAKGRLSAELHADMDAVKVEPAQTSEWA